MTDTWYQRAMPTVKDVEPHLQGIAAQVRSMPGVKAVYVTGSYAANADKPDFRVKDLDLIAVTDFDSGDLMAIDGGKHGPLKMASSEWEDYGFNPKAILFTRAYLALKTYGVDHWATSRDGKLLHWGPMPESVDEWQEVHAKAESHAHEVTGYNRLKLGKQDEQARRQWREAYMLSIAKKFSPKTSSQGWYPSDHSADEAIAIARAIE